MIIVSKRNLNLHRPKIKTVSGIEHPLIHVPAKKRVKVPDDVTEHSSWRLLVKDGTVTVLSKGKQDVKLQEQEPVLVAKTPKESAEETQEKVDPDLPAPAEKVDPESKIPAAEEVNEDDEEEES